MFRDATPGRLALYAGLILLAHWVFGVLARYILGDERAGVLLVLMILAQALTTALLLIIVVRFYQHYRRLWRR